MNGAAEADRDLYRAAGEGNIAAAEAAISRGASVHTPNEEELDRVPLHAAAAGGNSDMLQLLHKNGAKLNARDTRGCSCTALHYAVLCTRHPYVVSQLLTLGAGISIQDAGEETAFILAARLGCSAAIDSFLAHNRAELSAEDLLCAFKWATETQLDAADEVLANPASTAMKQQLQDTTDTSVALWDAAAAEDAAAAHSALCSSINVMSDVPLPYHVTELVAGMQRALLKKGAIATDLVKQRAAVQNCIIIMALNHKQQQREMTAQSQELAQQRQELEQMQHELAEQHRQVVQQLAQLNAA